MSELSIALHEWEEKAFARRRKPASMSIEVDGDAAVITGPAHVIRRAVDLGILNYVEFDGYIRASLDDPIPHRARRMANAVLQKIWKRRHNQCHEENSHPR